MRLNLYYLIFFLHLQFLHQYLLIHPTFVVLFYYIFLIILYYNITEKLFDIG